MSEMRNKKILIVDDDLINLEILKKILVTAGYSVLRASRGMDAVNMAMEDPPDLAILDIVMPDIDGGEVANRLRKNPLTKKIPIIFLSSLITKKEEGCSSRRQGISLVSKPFDREYLLRQIEVYL